MDFDFKKYHVRAMNAVTEDEKLAINQELKKLYESLPDDQKLRFNEELQSFLMREVASIKSVYDSVQGSEPSVN